MAKGNSKSTKCETKTASGGGQSGRQWCDTECESGYTKSDSPVEQHVLRSKNGRAIN
jgi:hypothetical protein